MRLESHIPIMSAKITITTPNDNDTSIYLQRTVYCILLLLEIIEVEQKHCLWKLPNHAHHTVC
jgi:hypothetical protein